MTAMGEGSLVFSDPTSFYVARDHRGCSLAELSLTRRANGAFPAQRTKIDVVQRAFAVDNTVWPVYLEIQIYRCD